MTQVKRVVKQAFGMLAFIDQGVESESWDVKLQLYESWVTLHSEHCEVQCRKDVVANESTERCESHFSPKNLEVTDSG